MPRQPIGERAMTDAERSANGARGCCTRRPRTTSNASGCGMRCSRPSSGTTRCPKRLAARPTTRKRARLNRGARYTAAAKLAWVEDHPGHSAEDYEHSGSCAATGEQERHWHDWSNDFSARYRDREPLAQELTEAHQENARLGRRIKELETKLARRERTAAAKEAAKPAPAPSEARAEIEALRKHLATAKKQI